MMTNEIIANGQLSLFDSTEPILKKSARLEQGQSIQTENKVIGFEAACNINQTIFKKKCDRNGNNYWHIDLNCGSGFNHKAGCIGSPLAFIQSAIACKNERYIALFCDINSDFLAELMLQEGIKNNPRCFPFNGNNASLVEALPFIIDQYGENPKFAVGMVLSDPNGTGVPIEELAMLSKLCPRLDVVIHWNSRVRKLLHGKGSGFIDIGEAIEKIHKTHWLIRETLGSRWGWTILIGRNIPVNDHRAMGYHHLNSEKGQEIFHSCKARFAEESYIQTMKQQGLFGDETF